MTAIISNVVSSYSSFARDHSSAMDLKTLAFTYTQSQNTSIDLVYAGTIKNLILNNYDYSFSITNLTLDRQALIDLFNSLGTPSTTQTITIGATNLAKLSSADLQIATDKNWVVQ